ncbi:MAG TPA: HRDC domain-containing protein [Flavobacterium sp.]|uniref:HRDC domain-containing protein n=1 Tax=Flavobacterium sp. TaxID=239 RepID=UPI002B4B78C9|nr:HRDC domain-containing protein [Flavobacterium sp.]HLO74272.1 HRDC domain-containing protein [Flavobacterium sp.]
MQVRVFSIRLDNEFLEYDQQQLNAFLSSVTFKKSSTQFVESEEAHWSVIVYYESEEQEKPERLERKSYEDLNPKDRQVYNYLRQWRIEKAEQLKIKNFMICHNSELIDLAMYKPSNLDELQQIKGFGKQKSERFGEDILSILNAV